MRLFPSREGQAMTRIDFWLMKASQLGKSWLVHMAVLRHRLRPAYIRRGGLK